MPVNQILPFATGTGANVMLPADYEALPAVSNGFSTGVASSQQLNTVWRQASVLAAMIAQFVVDLADVDVLDDGNVTTLKTNFEAALNALSLSNSHATALGIGADLSTTNTLDGVDLNTVIDVGDKYFKSTCTNAPFAAGLLKVWRENADVVYQLVQGAGNTGLAWRYYSLPIGHWLPWQYAAVTDSPEFLNNPTAPTQAADDNSTKLATTEYVDRAIGDIPAVTAPQGDSQAADISTSTTPAVTSYTFGALPSAGLLHVTAFFNSGGVASYNFHSTLAVTATGETDQSLTTDSVISHGHTMCIPVAAGASPVVSLSVTSDNPSAGQVRLSYLYIPT